MVLKNRELLAKPQNVSPASMSAKMIPVIVLHLSQTEVGIARNHR